MNEAETRAEHIDPALRDAGWGVVDGSKILREYRLTLGRIEGGGKRAKPLFADYVLVYRNQKLGVIEAKAWDKPLTEGVGQAKDYATKMRVRFAYATNGQGVYGIDMQTGKEGETTRYPSPDELWQIVFSEPNSWRDRFAAVPFEDKGGMYGARYYQDIAIDRVMQAIADNKTRILLTLATGTGKTFIAFQIAWKLFHSRWNLSHEPTRRPRILFLADRNILADQAYNAFSAFPEDALVRIAPDDIRKKGKVPKNGNLFFTIFQTFMSGNSGDANSGVANSGVANFHIGKNANQNANQEIGDPSSEPSREPRGYFGEYPRDFFDFIVIDECHRGGANDESNWRDIMEYFAPAVQLGLTATPKRQDNADTYKYFGEPVYVYSLKEGINDGYLTPFRVKQIDSTLDEYVYKSDDTVVEGEIEQGKRYTETDFNRIIEIKERERHRVEMFMDMIDQREKTLVFCATQDHALAVRDLINQIKTSSDPHYCERVTANDGALGEQYLRDFQDNEKTIPTILTTSQKLSTGVDARNIRNIVLMRPINSMIEFKQIIGRGTRLYDGKDYFTIYDFVEAHHHFQDPEWDGEPEPPDVIDPPKPHPYPTDTGKPKGGTREHSIIKVKLADGKDRAIQDTVVTSFWHPDGTPMTAREFMEQLFGKLPELFQSEAELRRLWSSPGTRAELLYRLGEKGFGEQQLTEMQKLLDAENSDWFDVLAYVAYTLPTVSREKRAALAHAEITSHYTAKQMAFIDFVLGHYVQVGVGELAPDKLTPLLKLKYNNALADAVADLGKPDEINKVFAGFQQYLYQQIVAA